MHHCLQAICTFLSYLQSIRFINFPHPSSNFFSIKDGRMRLGFSAYRHFSLNGGSLALFRPFLNLLTNTHFIYVQMRQKNKASIWCLAILILKGCFVIHNINILWQYPCSQHGSRNMTLIKEAFDRQKTINENRLKILLGQICKLGLANILNTNLLAPAL